VVDHGKGDGVFINTAGIGVIEHGLPIAPASVKLGDILILNGDIGRHGMAIMAAREGLAFENAIESDCAPLWEQVKSLLDAGIEIHCLRDLTRGGLASALVEIAEAAGVHISINENAISVMENVRGACEILGFDPLYVANEGRFVAFVPESQAQRAVDILRAGGGKADSAIIGKVSDGHPGFVTMKTVIGASRIVDMLSGEQLPRIC
jgi:hydrogenase expression/formation protein HypE